MKYEREVTELRATKRKLFATRKFMEKRKTLEFKEARDNKRAFIDLAMKLGPISNEEYRGGI